MRHSLCLRCVLCLVSLFFTGAFVAEMFEPRLSVVVAIGYLWAAFACGMLSAEIGRGVERRRPCMECGLPSWRLRRCPCGSTAGYCAERQMQVCGPCFRSIERRTRR